MSRFTNVQLIPVYEPLADGRWLWRIGARFEEDGVPTMLGYKQLFQLTGVPTDGTVGFIFSGTKDRAQDQAGKSLSKLRKAFANLNRTD